MNNKQFFSMKIAIVGAGFTGLSAGLKLSKAGHQVIIFEKEKNLGGLAGTFKKKNWQWPLEKHYHHWFTNDKYVIDLIKELKMEKFLFFPKTLTSIYLRKQIFPFDSPAHVLNFSPLPFLDRLRTGFVLFFLKIFPQQLACCLENSTASDWLSRWFGKKSYACLWQPLLKAKFGLYYTKVNMAWFWARIKKRTPRLGYLKKSYDYLLQKMAQQIKKNGSKILLGTEFNPQKAKAAEFDKILITAPSSVFVRLFPQLAKEYQQKLLQIPHLLALNLLVISQKKFLNKTYWLNINENDFPFIAIIQHTNMVSASYYGDKNLMWIANYLPQDHPYLKMTKEKLFQLYLPYLKIINPDFDQSDEKIKLERFLGDCAQPVFFRNYSRIKPDFHTPLANVYLANMDMVYPWDRGTNYAIELGYKAAERILSESK